MLITARAGAAIFTTITDSTDVVLGGQSFRKVKKNPTANIKNITTTLINPFIISSQPHKIDNPINNLPMVCIMKESIQLVKTNTDKIDEIDKHGQNADKNRVLCVKR